MSEYKAQEVSAATGGSLISALRRNLPAFGAVVWIAGFGLIAQLIASLREILIARDLGVGDSVDALVIAFLVPGLLATVLLGPVAAALIPILIKADHDGGHGDKAAGNALTMGLIVAVVMALTLALFRAPILALIAPDFSPPKLLLAEQLLMLFLPSLPLQTLITFWAAGLNGRGRYFWAAFAPIFFPVPAIVFLGMAQGSIDVRLLPAAYSLGAALCTVALATAVHRSGSPVWPRWFGGGIPVLREFLRQYQPLFMATLVGNGMLMTDQIMAAKLGQGSLATLSYGNKVTSVALNISVVALATVVLPQLSNLTARSRAGEVRSTLAAWVLPLGVGSTAAAATLYLLSEPITRMIYERGAFGPAETHVVAQVQAFCALQLPFFLIGAIAVRYLNAVGLNTLILISSVVNFIANIVFNLLFIHWFGLPGIALATSVVYAISCLLLWIVVAVRLHSKQTKLAV